MRVCYLSLCWRVSWLAAAIVAIVASVGGALEWTVGTGGGGVATARRLTQAFAVFFLHLLNTALRVKAGQEDKHAQGYTQTATHLLLQRAVQEEDEHAVQGIEGGEEVRHHHAVIVHEEEAEDPRQRHQ